MAMKITADILESYLQCKYKAHLKLANEQGIKSEYESLLLRSLENRYVWRLRTNWPETRMAMWCGALPSRSKF